MRAQDAISKISELETTSRLEMAKRKTERLVDHCLRQIYTFNNRRALNDLNGLAGRLPKARATRSFNTLKHDYTNYEIMKLQTLWQKVDLDADNIPTVVALINSSPVRSLIIDFHTHQHTNSKFSERYRSQQIRRLDTTIKLIERLKVSNPVERLDNIRHKIVHNLEVTRKERIAQNPIVSPTLVEVNRLTIGTIISIKGLYGGINGVGFDFNESMKISKRNATNLWSNLEPDLAKIF